jgi:hypothetical protein
MGINIIDYGAVGDGKTLCTEAIQRAVNAARQTSAGITVPPGTFLTGTIDISGVSMHLEKGAALKGSPNMEDYPPQPYIHNEFRAVRALLVCYDSARIVISGEGLIDLNGGVFFNFDKPMLPSMQLTDAQKKECPVSFESRPNQCLFFHQVSHVTLRDITIIGAPCWTITFSECNDVKALNLSIDNSLNIPNNDGIHVSACSGVIISGCHISSADDCLAFSAITNWEKPCENIVICDCILRSCSKAIVLGYVHSHVRNVVINNVIIRESNRGFCIMSNPETGLVENVRASNMIIETQVRAGNYWGNGEAVFIMALEQAKYVRAEQRPARHEGVNIRNISMEGIHCHSENALGIIGCGKNIEGLMLRDMVIRRKASKNLYLKGGIFDAEPCNEKYAVPENCDLYITETKDVSVSGIRMDGRIVIERADGFEAVGQS